MNTQTPTLNATYNDLLVRWAQETGIQYLPACEDCECDLTGCEVIETNGGWFCEECAEDNGYDPVDDGCYEDDCVGTDWSWSDREDFYAD